MGYIDSGGDAPPPRPPGTPPPPGGPPGAAPGAMKDLPVFGAPREILTVHTNGQWKVPGTGTPGEDNFGDGQMILDRNVVPHLLRLAYRSGGTVNGGVYTDKPYGDLYSGWSVPGAAPEPENPEKTFSSRHLTNSVNLDTFGLVLHGDTGVITALMSARPGSLSDPDTGYIYSVQRRTSIPPHASLSLQGNWADYGARHEVRVSEPPESAIAWHIPREQSYPGPPYEWKGGTQEASIIYDPGAPGEEFVVFYVAKSEDRADTQWGTFHKNRIGRMYAPASTFNTEPVWTQTPEFGDTSWNHDPQSLPGYEPTGAPPWGTMPGNILQPHVTISPYDRSYHLIRLGHKPDLGQGNINNSLAIGHWWSHDRGQTWTGDSRAPIISLGTLIDTYGWSVSGFANRLNSPHLMFDTMTNVLYLLFWGNPIGEQNKTGTRFWAMAAPLGADKPVLPIF